MDLPFILTVSSEAISLVAFTSKSPLDVSASYLDCRMLHQIIYDIAIQLKPDEKPRETAR